MKKLWITLGMIAAALTCMLLAIYFFAPAEKIDSGDETSPYPYSYEIRSGKVKIIITGEFPEGCEWLGETADDIFTVKAGRQTAKKATFTLTPQRAGNTSVSFILHQPGDLPDRRMKITSSFLVTQDAEGELTVSVQDSSHQELKGLVGADAETFSYRIAALSDNTLYVRISHDASQTWTYEKVGSSVTLGGSSADSGELARAEDGTYSGVGVTGGEAGATKVYLDSSTGESIELSFSTGSGGVTSLLSHRIMDADDVRVEKDAAETAYTDYYGDASSQIASVLGESTGRVERWLSRADELTTFTVGVSEYDDGAWMLCISPIADEADFAGNGEPTLQVTEGEASANLYTGDFGVRSVWRTGGNTYLLESGNDTQETAEALTRELLALLAQ